MLLRQCLAACIVISLPAALPALTQAAPEDDHVFVWNLGRPDDLDPAKVPHVEPADRIGDAGADGDTTYRLLKPNAFQVMFLFPAFDIAGGGAVNHPFYLTLRFKDVSNRPTAVWAGKGGCGFYGAGPVGAFGGAGDGQWKEETLVIPRSMMRSRDGKTFLIKFTDPKAAVPLASLTLFSADSRMPGAKEKMAAALKADADKREALRRRLLPQFKDLGLPDPGPCPEYTAAEKERGFRVFFPPVSRQLFANSQPQEGELADSIHLYACHGQTLSLVVAVRGLKDLGRVSLDGQDPFAAAGPAAGPRWAVYSEQRIGSSWGKEYRVCPEQLVLGADREVKPDRLEIACLTLRVSEGAAPGDRAGRLVLTAEKGGKATVPVTVTVYPFKLERPDHSTHGQFYYCDYGDVDPHELEDMADHGMDTVVSGLGAPVAPGPDGKRATGPTRQAFWDLKDLGYRAPLIDSTGYLEGLLKDEKKRPQYAAIVAETLGIAREEGFEEMGFFPVDEPHAADRQAVALKACTWIRDVPGANTYITSNPAAVKVLDPVLNYVCYNITYLNAETIRSMKPHQKLMFYCPSMDVNPEFNRFRPGFYQAKVGAYSSQYFAYMEFAGDPFCDLDGDNRDWNVVYPSMESPTHDPTLEWEAMREGVYDFRYAFTLRAMAARAAKKGKEAEAAKALKVLDEVLAAVDVDGNKAGGPALAIEADVRLKDTKIDPAQLAQAKALRAASWYEQSRRKIAAAIVELRKAAGE